jgi:hypothetical protein
MRHGRQQRGGMAALGFSIALLGVTPAGAGEPSTTSRLEDRVEILAHADGIAAEHPGWSFLSSLRISKDHGLSYRHSFVLGGRRLQVRLRGPVQRRKSLGLGFQIRF